MGTGRGATMAEIETPAPVNTYDTAATVARLLGPKPPPCWIARRVQEAFETVALNAHARPALRCHIVNDMSR